MTLEMFQRARYNRAVEYLFAVFSIIVLIGPIYVLNAIHKADPYVQTTAVFVSTALFAFLLSSATAAKRHEVFAATSAYVQHQFEVNRADCHRYCAVLVVFTSQYVNGNGNGN